ncbi:MAG: tRNA pseudouridine synthase B [Pirellulaceae bacterium]|nr:MAG: tRNA pseudouridine synthase B [Pirellulaceae bacterium]
MFGWLNIDKPQGITSRDAVNVIQKLVAPAKVGHAGTLDPLATGVLVLGIGPATRLISYVQQKPKKYRARFRFGWQSPTDDIEGPASPVEGPLPSREELEEVCRKFVGRVEQVPPDFSAVKVAGQRAYHLARKGTKPQLQARTVEVYSLELVAYEPPEWEIVVRCGAGTYIRALGRDIARRLDTAAIMVSLRREAVGNFTLADAVPLEQYRHVEDVLAHMIEPIVALGEWPQIMLDNSQQRALSNGQWIRLAPAPHGARELVAVNAAGQPIAILERAAGGKFRPVINLAPPGSSMAES